MALARALQPLAAAASANGAQQQAPESDDVDKDNEPLRVGSTVLITDVKGNTAATGVVKLLNATDVLMPALDPNAKVGRK